MTTPEKKKKLYTVANAHLQMGGDASLREDGGVFRLHSPNGHVGIECFQRFTDAGNGSACTNSGTKSMNGTVCLF